MWGINHTVRELSHISIPVMLMPDDFRAFTKIKIDNHAFNKENLPSHFKVRSRIILQFNFTKKLVKKIIEKFVKLIYNSGDDVNAGRFLGFMLHAFNKENLTSHFKVF